MKKAVVFIIVLLICAMSVPTYAVSSETDSGIFYSIENGEVTVEGFNYVGTVLDIPEKIDGYPVKYVSNQACRGNYGITELRLPSTIVSIGEYAFAECDNLTKVVMRGGTTVGYSAFRDCKALLSLTLPDGLTLIDDSAFEGCTMLGRVKIPTSVEIIGTDAFMGCERLSFDASDNEYAKQYARENSIPTSFLQSDWIRAVSIILISVAAVTAVLLLQKKYKSKRLKGAKD